MKLPGLIFATLSLLSADGARGADATTPVDYTQRNQPFAPAATVSPEKNDLPRADVVQDKRVDKTTIDKHKAAVGDRRAALPIEETREKVVREKQVNRPETVEQPMSAFNHRDATIVTAAETRKPPTVAKYQDSLSAASASNMARFPAMDGATTARINRFVFRKNSPDGQAVTADAAVTPAGGVSSPARK
ncbi:MAG: hypothetical protein HZA93_22525 [Verrucomicrobia bacterium]|nr:hypothetical protein [Verrucomicrobiota bacterium]